MKILKIEKCWQCYHKSAFHPDICTLTNIIIDDVFHAKIPNWCPLSNAPSPDAGSGDLPDK